MAPTKQAEFNKNAGKPIRCRAAVARKPGEPLVIEEVIVAPPQAREVRLKIICTSLCYSDITFWKMKEFPGCFPRILGHEAFGVVESVGGDVQEFKEGDPVVPIFLADCMECVDCKSNKSNLCSKFPFEISPWNRDGTSRFTTIEGETLYHFLFISSFAEYTVVPVAHVTKMDPIVPPNRACLLSCGVSTSIFSHIIISTEWVLLGKQQMCGTRFNSSDLWSGINWISSCRGSKAMWCYQNYWCRYKR